MNNIVIVASIIGFWIGSNTSMGLALFMGAFFGLIAWAFTGFSMGKSAKKNYADDDNLNKISANTKNHISELSAHDLGKFLIQTLVVSVQNTTPTEEEIKSLKIMGISKSRYLEEITSLSICAQLAAISRLIEKIEIRDKIIEGYWEEFKQGSFALQLPESFKSKLSIRFTAYSSAFLMDKKSKIDGGVNNVTLKFADFIGGNSNSEAFIIASYIASSTFDTQYHLAIKIISLNNFCK